MIDLEFAPNGDLYVASDETVSRVEFDNQGNVQSVDYNFVNIPVTASGGSFSAGLAIDDDGSMYVTHIYTQTAAGKIYSFDTLGNISLFAQGFNQPRDIIFDDEHRMYVSDFLGGKIYVIEPLNTLTVSLQGTDLDCYGSSSGMIIATSAGGADGHSYLWSTGQTTSTISSLAAGTYTVTVTDGNGNTVVDSLAINQPDSLAILTYVQDEICANNNDGWAASLPVGGTSPYTHLWSTGADSFAIINLSPGTYTVTITDANGCTSTDQATIGTTLFTDSIASQNENCLNNGDGWATAVPVGVSAPFTYSWSNGAVSNTATNLLAGTYTVTITDSNGCMITDEAIIGSNPFAGSIVSENENCLNNGDGWATATPMGGVAPFMYAWSNGANSSTATNLVAGAYTVTITDSNGCVITDEAIIGSNLFTDSIITENEQCLNEGNGWAKASPVGGTAPFVYAWSNGANVSTVENLSPGTYMVTITDSNGCITTDQAVIGTEFSTLPQPGLGPDTVINGQASYLLDPGSFASYLWQDGSTGIDFSVTVSGTYWVLVTDDNGCSNADSVTVTMWPIGIEEVKEASFRVYPNPASEMLSIQLVTDHVKEFNVRLIDQTGREVLATRSGNATRLLLDVSGLTSGVYMAELVSGLQTQVVRVLVQR